MRDKRLLPALADGTISEAELVSILNETEDYGHQHVFLFQAKKNYISEIMNREYLVKVVRNIAREEILVKPDLVESTESLTLTDARLEESGKSKAFIFKAMETIKYIRPIPGEIEDGADGRYFMRRFERVEERAVHVLRVHNDGLVELCPYSFDGSLSYQEKADELWLFFGSLIDRFKCVDWSVSKAQNAFWGGRRGEYQGRIKYGDSRVRDLHGNTASFASGGESKNLFDADNARKGYDAFFGEDGTCDRSNIWFLSQEDSNGCKIPARDVHVRFSGSVNEFSLPGSCARKDYEYVLAQICRANR